MSFPAYPGYKDSGVDWLGDIPEGWSIKPLWALFRRHKLTGFPDEQLLSVYRDYGVILKASRDDNFNKPSDDLGAYQLVQVGDLAINKMKAWQGSVGISSYKGIVSPAYHVYAPNHSEAPQYLHHLFRCNEYIAGYLANSKGIRVNQWDLEPQQHSRMSVLLPPVQEQTQIARFLDHETNRIDALIEEQQRLIELLKEKRQAVISHTVTKGLDPTVPIKDSGVEWLGEVPAHWGVKALRYLGECQNGINIGGEAFGSGSPFVSYGDVYKNDVLPAEVTGLVQSSPEDQQRYSIEYGDVFFTRTSETVDEIGFSATCLQELPNAVFAGFLIRFRPTGKSLTPGFSKYYFRNQGLRIFFNKEMNLVTRASLSQDLLKLLPVTLPPIVEQIKISDFLEKVTAEFASLLEQGIKAIDLLKERRSALISAVVTGKIDVRGWQPPASAPIPELVQEAV